MSGDFAMRKLRQPLAGRRVAAISRPCAITKPRSHLLAVLIEFSQNILLSETAMLSSDGSPRPGPQVLRLEVPAGMPLCSAHKSQPLGSCVW